MRALTLMIIALLVGLPGPAAAGTQPENLDSVLRQLEIDEVPADYVVLVDLSGSMADNGRYDEVRTVLRTFFGSLRPVDRVSLWTFNNTPTGVHRGAPEGGLAAVDRMPAPAGATDIGAAIDAALTDLSQPDAHPAAAVVLLSDGAQNATGTYADPNGNGPGWAALAEKAKGLTGPGRTLRGFGFPLSGDTAGANLLKTVIPRTEVLDKPTGQLGDHLRRTADELRRGIAADRLTPDLAGTVEVRWPDLGSGADLSGPDIPITVSLRTTTEHLKVELVDAEVVSDLGPVTGLPERITLLPGESVQVELTLHLDGASRFTLGTSQPVDTRLRLTGGVDTPWHAVVQDDLKLRLNLRALDTSTPVRGSISYGLPWWVPLAAVALIAVVALGLVRRWVRRNPRLVGVLLVDPPAAASLPVELAGRRRVRLDGGRTGHMLGISGPCVIRGRRTGRYDPPTLVISYAARGAEPVTRLCPPGAHQEIAGLRFWYMIDRRGTPTERPGYPYSVPR